MAAGMPWLRMDVRYLSHPKVRRAGPDATLLHLAGLGYCAEHLTDGVIPAEALPLLAPVAWLPDPAPAVERLTSVGLWVPCGDDWLVHDYLDHQQSRAAVEAERAAWRERQARHRKAQHNGHGAIP